MPDHTIPDPEADPEQAALRVITYLPAKIIGTGFTAVWAAYAAVLAEHRAFRGLDWADAGNCAYMIADAITRPDPADVLLNHVRDALAGTDGVGWCNRERVARAFVLAATDDE